MQKENLETLVNDIRKYKCEMQTVEVKSARNGCPTRLFDTLSAFSNQDDGGIILFGLDEKSGFALVGVYDAQDLQQRVSEQCKQMQPNVRPLFSLCDLEGKIVVSAEIPGLDIADRPAYYKGAGRMKGSFIRVGEADEPMSDYEIYSYDAYRRRLNDDLRLAERAEISQFDKGMIDQYLHAIKDDKPNVAKLADEEILELTGIVKSGRPTLAGVLCFSKYPQAIFPQLCITAVVIAGTRMGETGNDGERFVANRKIEGTMREMLDEAVLFVRRNMREKTIISDEGKRIDKTEYPTKAVREAILNALMHRDYSIHTEGAPVRILMFSDRMEIINAGGLYGKLTIDSLGKVHGDTRNQTLTNILEILKIAENRYSGIPTIRMEMEEYHLPEPVFEGKRGNFIVTFKNGMAVHKEYSSVKKGNSEVDLLEFCTTPKSRKEISDFIGQTQYYTVKSLIWPLINEGKLELTIPEKPKSKNQRYFTHRGFKKR